MRSLANSFSFQQESPFPLPGEQNREIVRVYSCLFSFRLSSSRKRQCFGFARVHSPRRPSHTIATLNDIYSRSHIIETPVKNTHSRQHFVIV